MLKDIPEKKYYKIGEVSRIFDLEPHVLRFWESEFAAVKPKKDSGNQRLYQKKDLESIARIKKLLYEDKFTIAGAKEKIKELDAGIYVESSGRATLADIRKGLQEIVEILEKS